MSTRRIIASIFVVITIVGVFGLIKTKSGCRIVTEKRMVQGDSLKGVINAGETVEAQFGYYGCHEPERGDIAMYQYGSSGEPFIKIIKAMPGDQWELRPVDGDKTHIVVNGELLLTSSGEPYAIDAARAKLLGLYIRDYSSVIPPDTYLILGNLPEGTEDSTAFGLAARSKLVGKVLH